MRRIIAIIILIIVGIVMFVVGWELDKIQSTTTTTALFIFGMLLIAGMLGVVWRDIRDYITEKIRNFINK